MLKKLGTLAVLLAVALGGSQTSKDYQTEEISGGFVRVITPTYTLEVPKGWTVGRETGFGQRTLSSGKAQMTAMTAAGADSSSWERLYRTSLYFISRENPGKPTPYVISKSAQGYEACSFSVLDAKGFANARYVILKNPKGAILALSVKIPEQKSEKELAAAFERMVRTATLK